MKFLALIPLLLASQLANSQIDSGTLIVLQVVNNKLIMASDSRMMAGNIPEDGHCKIAAFSNHLVFGTSGGFGPNAFDEAGRDVKQFPFDAVKVADTWAKNMQKLWETNLRTDSQSVRQFVRSQNRGQDNGAVGTGIFVVPINGTFEIMVRQIEFMNDAITIDSSVIECEGGPCGIGHSDIFYEYTRKTSQRAKEEKWLVPPPLIARADPEMLRIIKLIELTTKYDSSKSVGGDIDAMEMESDGSVNWIQNPNCPKTYQ